MRLRTSIFCVLVGIVLQPWAAAAQSCSEPSASTVFVGTPSNAAMDVPTNVVFFYKIPGQLGAPTPGMFYLHSGEGATIALHAQRVYGDYLQLQPEHALAPNLSHQLSGTWRVTDQTDEALLFWTGAGPFVGPPDPPEVSVQHYRMADEVPVAKCGPARFGTCLAFGSSSAVVEYTLLNDVGEEREPASAMGAVMVDLTGLDPNQSARCVKLRARGPDGSLSEPTTVCGDDFPVWEADQLAVRCTPKGLSWQGMAEEPNVVRKAHERAVTAQDAGTPQRAHPSAAHGCSVTMPGRSASSLPLVAFALLLLCERGRRRNQARVRRSQTPRAPRRSTASTLLRGLVVISYLCPRTRL